ncbi:MAG: radical SAM protein [Rhizobacter sp.]|nr:radical SAM protein [Chlorobiales bacterium]
MPLLCNYYLTYRCNAECGFCDIWQKPSPYADMKDIEANLRDMRRLGVRFVDFTGGEPLLHRDLPEILALAKRLGFITSVTTNTLLYPKFAKDLAGKIELLHFSLDSVHKEKHDASRGVKCYDKLLESVEIAKSLGEHPDILFTVHEQNYEELQDVYENISRPNGLILIINPIFQYGKFFTAEDSEKMFQSTLAFSKKSLVYMNGAFIKLRRDGGNHVEKPVCKAVSQVVVISPANEMILPCYHFGEKKIPIEGNLYALRTSEMIAEEIKMEGRHKFCEGCAVNCYMEPSFATSVNEYAMYALPSKTKYMYYKTIRHGLLKRHFKERFASLKQPA